MTEFRPFADDAATMSFGELTIENGTDRIALYGSLDLTRDKAGLEHARKLKTLLEQVVHALEAAGGSLPNQVPPPEKPTTVKNPFG